MTARPSTTPTPSLSLLMTQQCQTAYREEDRDLTVWCKDNNLSLNVNKTKEMIVEYRKRRTKHAPILIDGAVVEPVESFKFLGVHITNKLTWSKQTKTVVKKARQNLFPLRRLKIFGMGPQILKKFCSYTIGSCLVWQLLGLRPYGPVIHWGKGSCHPRPLYQAVSEERHKRCQRLQPP